MRPIILLILFTAFTASLNAQWIIRDHPLNGTYINIDMVSNSVAYAVGVGNTGSGTDRGYIAKTTNGGVNWFTSFEATNSYLNGVSFVNENTGYVVGQYKRVLKTTNGGTNWTILLETPGQNRSFFCVSFLNANTGLVSGGNGLVRKTTDGGTTWDSNVVAASNTVFRNAKFVNENTAFLISDDNAYKTTDGGANWQVVLQLSGEIGQNIFMFNSQTGFISGSVAPTSVVPAKGYIYKTTNAGTNWDLIADEIPAILYGVYFTSLNTGYVYGGYYSPPFGPSSYIAKTTNGGVNWTPQTFPGDRYIKSLDFYSADTGIAVSAGDIVNTFNGGSVAIHNLNSQIPDNFSLSQNYPNPFNPSTKIRFDIPRSSFVKLAVYDVLGREVSSLVNENLNSDTYEYTFEASGYNSGVYFYKLETEGFVETRKMMLLK